MHPGLFHLPNGNPVYAYRFMLGLAVVVGWNLSKDAAGGVFHTYSTYGRGLDMLVGAYSFLDLAPKGRDEDNLSLTMGWVRHHDRY